jgi:hypothetical protein
LFEDEAKFQISFSQGQQNIMTPLVIHKSTFLLDRTYLSR